MKHLSDSLFNQAYMSLFSTSTLIQLFNYSKARKASFLRCRFPFFRTPIRPEKAAGAGGVENWLVVRQHLELHSMHFRDMIEDEEVVAMEGEIKADSELGGAICQNCKAKFLLTRSWQRFCTPPCRDRWHNEERRAALTAYRTGRWMSEYRI